MLRGVRRKRLSNVCARTMLRDRRVSRSRPTWLGQTPLLKTLFTPAAEWRELSDYLLRAVAAVAREPYDGDDARQRVEFLAVISLKGCR